VFNASFVLKNGTHRVIWLRYKQTWFRAQAVPDGDDVDDVNEREATYASNFHSITCINKPD